MSDEQLDPLELVHVTIYRLDAERPAPKYAVEMHCAGGAVERMLVPDGPELQSFLDEMRPPEITVRLPRGVTGTLMRGPDGSYLDYGETMESQIAKLEQEAGAVVLH